MNEEIEKPEYESPKASIEAIIAADKALKEIRHRSFSDRNPELGRMIKCQVCGLRHRSVIKCEQRFVELWIEEDLETGEKTTVYATAVQPKGIEIPSQASAHHPTIKQVIGAAVFKGKRLNPHPNKRNLQFIETVRAALPLKFTDDDMKKVQARARRVLSNKLGRHGFLPPRWKNVKQEAEAAPSA